VPPDWSWAFPSGIPAVPDKPDAVKPLHLPGSPRPFTEAQVHDLTHAVDWFPGAHPAMPDAVRAGHAGANACGFCHLPAGEGRPENSSLAGLPADYIERQVAAFADGSRQPALPSAASRLMAATAKAASAADVASAAAYYSKLGFRTHVSVVEVAEIAPPQPYRFIYVLGEGPKIPIGTRVIEVPANVGRFELRDPRTHFTAYVPKGALAQGAALAAGGGAAGLPCAACHGAGLRGGIAPPLAGRSPTTMVRQLMGFKAGTRANAEAAPMRAVAEKLSNGDMVSLAAYAASLKPR
jgi:cytochrome c553